MKLIPYAQRRDSKFTQRFCPAKKNLGGDCMHGYMKSILRVNVSGLHYSRQIKFQDKAKQLIFWQINYFKYRLFKPSPVSLKISHFTNTYLNSHTFAAQ